MYVSKRNRGNIDVAFLYRAGTMASKFLRVLKENPDTNKINLSSKQRKHLLKRYYINPATQYFKGMDFDVIVTPPSKFRKEKKDGIIKYIAKEISKNLGIEYIDIFEYHNDKGGYIKGKLEREIEPFKMKKKLENKFILVVDDFVQTGITMKKVVLALRPKNRIFLFAFVR